MSALVPRDTLEAIVGNAIALYQSGLSMNAVAKSVGIKGGQKVGRILEAHGVAIWRGRS